MPSFTGNRTWDHVPLKNLVPLIDWTPFFHAWELKGIYPRILQDPVVGPRAQELFDDAKKLLAEIVDGNLLTARAVAGFFPANSVGDDIELYTDEARTRPLATFFTLRQQMQKPDGEPEYALADFIAPKETGLPDYLGAFAVTAGVGAAEQAARFEKAHDDYNAIMVKALADRLAEALAEWMHKQARDAWGYGREEKLSLEEVLKEQYRGIRPAPAIQLRPTIPRKTLYSLCSTRSARRASSSRKISPCCRPHRSAACTSRILKRAILPWAKSAAIRCSIISVARGWNCAPSNAGLART